MNHRLKLVVTVGLVLALSGVGYALFQQTGENLTYYYEADEVQAADIGDRKIKLSGIVAGGSVERDAKTLYTTFAVTGATSRFDVAYTGPVPDIFGPGIQVVVHGAFNEKGVFEADDLMAKCPSKYEAEGSTKDFEHLGAHPAGIPIGGAATTGAEPAAAPHYEYDYRAPGRSAAPGPPPAE